jgi:hypothetical protein
MISTSCFDLKETLQSRVMAFKLIESFKNVERRFKDRKDFYTSIIEHYQNRLIAINKDAAQIWFDISNNGTIFISGIGFCEFNKETKTLELSSDQKDKSGCFFFGQKIHPETTWNLPPRFVGNDE